MSQRNVMMIVFEAVLASRRVWCAVRCEPAVGWKGASNRFIQSEQGAFTMSGKECHEHHHGVASTILCASLLAASLFSMPAGSVHAATTCYDGGLIIAASRADPEYSESKEHWSDGKEAGYGCKAIDFRLGYRTTRTVGAWAKWTPAVAKAGTYRVYFWIVGHTGGKVNIEVHYQGGVKKISRNTNDGPLGWANLGDYDFAAGAEGYVLATSAGGHVCVDAIKLLSTNNLAEIKLPPYPQPDGSVPHVDKLGGGNIVVCGQKRIIYYGETCEEYNAEDIPYFGDACDTWLRQGLNTMAMTLAWRDVEPTRDKYDTRMIDAMVDACKARNMHLIIVWFGTWRNLQSNYLPGYIGKEKFGFPALKKDGNQENGGISPFATKCAERDGLALKALLAAAAKKDPGHQVLIGVQVENEMPLFIDFSPAANEHIGEQVPQEVLDMLQREFKTPNHLGNAKQGWPVWVAYKSSGFKTSGTWAEVLSRLDVGDPKDSARQFMGAYYTGKYIEIVVRKAKEALHIPMYANAWVGASPCDSNFMDIFHIGCPSLDGMGPDNPDWEGYVRVNYRRPWNSLVNPEFFFYENTFNAIADGAFLFGNYFGNEYELSNCRWINPLVSSMEPLLIEKRYDGSVLGFGQHPANVGPAEHGKTGDTWEKSYQDMMVKFTALTTPGEPNVNHYNTSGPELAGNGIIIKMDADDYVVTSTKIDVELRYADGRPMRVLGAEQGHFERGKWVKEKDATVEATGKSLKLKFPTENLKYGQIRLKFAAPK